MENKIEIIKKGHWLYNNEIPISIEIVKQNWDFYYEEGYENEPPDLNELGEAYYVIFDDYTDIRYATRSHTCLSLNEAIEYAESKIESVTWIN